MTWFRALRPPWQAAVFLLALGWGVTGAVGWVSAAHAQRRAAERVCVAELAALRARNPFVEKFIAPWEPCEALKIVRDR